MPTDHPDGTRSIVLSRADIQMPIDVQHQTVNVKTNFKEQEVGVYSQPEWAAKEGWDKTFIIEGTLAFGEYAELNYVVGMGKKLFINAITFRIYATAAEDYDHMIYGAARIRAAGSEVLHLGGLGGGGLALPRPIIIPVNGGLQARIFSYTNFSCEGSLAVLGYEITE